LCKISGEQHGITRNTRRDDALRWKSRQSRRCDRIEGWVMEWMGVLISNVGRSRQIRGR
jgi:hypothetical protein